MVAERFRLGVNYWPVETAMRWLERYDAAAVRRDFGRIAGAGMDTIRIFVRWEDVQPGPATIDAIALNNVVDAADAAAEAGVELIVTLFTGHMSGVNWIPSWATGGEDGDERFRVLSGGSVRAGRVLRNWYGDREMVAAQARMAAGVSAALAGHPAVWAWDLGNENSNCTIPPSPRAAEAWLATMTSVLRTNDPGSLVTVGTHMEDLENDRRIGPAEAARWCDFVCMHGYPIYADWAAGPLDDDLVLYLGAVTAWLAGDAPVLFAEFGHPTAPPDRESDAAALTAPSPLAALDRAPVAAALPPPPPPLAPAPGHLAPAGVLVSEAEAAAYAGRTIDALAASGNIGALLWCYADYAANLFHAPPLDLATHERTFGMWRADHTPKPVVAEVRARHGLVRAAPPSAASRPWVDITTVEFAADRKRHLVRLYQRYRRFRATATAP